MNIIEIIYNAFLNEPVVYGENMNRLIEIGKHFEKILSEEQMELFKEYDNILSELKSESELELIKYIFRICKIILI